MMLIEVIHEGSVPYCGCNDDNSTVVYLSEILFSFMLENILSAMHVDWDPPSFDSSNVVCYTYLDLFHAGIDHSNNATEIRKVLLSM